MVIDLIGEFNSLVEQQRTVQRIYLMIDNCILIVVNNCLLLMLDCENKDNFNKVNILNGGKQSDFDKPAGTNCASNIIGENCENIGETIDKISDIVLQ